MLLARRRRTMPRQTSKTRSGMLPKEPKPMRGEGGALDQQRWSTMLPARPLACHSREWLMRDRHARTPRSLLPTEGPDKG